MRPFIGHVAQPLRREVADFIRERINWISRQPRVTPFTQRKNTHVLRCNESKEKKIQYSYSFDCYPTRSRIPLAQQREKNAYRVVLVRVSRETCATLDRKWVDFVKCFLCDWQWLFVKHLSRLRLWSLSEHSLETFVIYVGLTSWHVLRI